VPGREERHAEDLIPGLKEPDTGTDLFDDTRTLRTEDERRRASECPSLRTDGGIDSVDACGNDSDEELAAARLWRSAEARCRREAVRSCSA
jgi:hypothetical protein